MMARRAGRRPQPAIPGQDLIGVDRLHRHTLQLRPGPKGRGHTAAPPKGEREQESLDRWLALPQREC